MSYVTISASVSGAICGKIWWPVGQQCGAPFRVNLRGPFGIMDRSVDPRSFRDALDGYLIEHGGDYQCARFSADTSIRIERRRMVAPGKYELHVWERELTQLKDCADLVDPDLYTSDFFNDWD